MNFFEAVKSAFSKYGTIAGRSLRSEYWYFALFFIIGFYVSAIIDTQTAGVSLEDALLEEFLGPILTIFLLVMFIPQVTVTVRRFHDIGMSGWWALVAYCISFISFDYPLAAIGMIPFFYLMCKKGDEYENRFGPDPLASDKKQ